MLRRMDTPAPNRTLATRHDGLPPASNATAAQPLTAAGLAALAAAQALVKKATAAATLRAYKADWTHFSHWCAARGSVPVPAAPQTVGASRQSGRQPRADDDPPAAVGIG